MMKRKTGWHKTNKFMFTAKLRRQQLREARKRGAMIREEKKHDQTNK